MSEKHWELVYCYDGVGWMSGQSYKTQAAAKGGLTKLLKKFPSDDRTRYAIVPTEIYIAYCKTQFN